MFYTFNGVIGGPISVCAKFIVVFIIFGAFLERTGIAQFFINLANCVAGSSPGGPAKVAVISSALCGMVSGSSVGNTVTTGSVTIPMMKKHRLSRASCRAVEAAASTGGQIMPPHYGGRRLPHGGVHRRAPTPASPCWPFCRRCSTSPASTSPSTWRPRSWGCGVLGKDELPRFRVLVKKIYLLLPLVLLVVLVSNGTRTMSPPPPSPSLLPWPWAWSTPLRAV